jgi:hypothetical protein
VVVLRFLNSTGGFVLLIDRFVELVLGFVCALISEPDVNMRPPEDAVHAYLDSMLIFLLRVLEVLDNMVKVLLIMAFIRRDPLLKVANLGVGGHAARVRTAKRHVK